MKAVVCVTWMGWIVSSQVYAARLNLASFPDGGGSMYPPNILRLDVVWTMNVTDTSTYDLDGFDARFNVWHPSPNHGQLTVLDAVSPVGWNTSITHGIGGPFSELDFFLSVNDTTWLGISGNGSEFDTVISSIFLRQEGNLAGTEITFRHESPNDPLPAAHDGPVDWQLRWQYEVTGPFQFDIGAGNPGDGPPSWPYHGYESAAPIVIPPEPSPLLLLLLGGLALLRFRR